MALKIGNSLNTFEAVMWCFISTHPWITMNSTMNLISGDHHKYEVRLIMIVSCSLLVVIVLHEYIIITSQNRWDTIDNLVVMKSFIVYHIWFDLYFFSLTIYKLKKKKTLKKIFWNKFIYKKNAMFITFLQYFHNKS